MNTCKTLIALSIAATTLVGCGGDDNPVKKLKDKVDHAVDLGKQVWDCEHNMGGEWKDEGKTGHCKLPKSKVEPKKEEVVIDPTVPAEPKVEETVAVYTAPKEEQAIDNAFTSLAAEANVPMEVLKDICMSDLKTAEDIPALTCRIAKDEQGEEKAVVVGIHIDETPFQASTETNQTDYTVQLINLTDRTLSIRYVSEYALKDTKQHFVNPLLTSGYAATLEPFNVDATVAVEGGVQNLGHMYSVSYEWSMDLETNRDAVSYLFENAENLDDDFSSVFKATPTNVFIDERVRTGRYLPEVETPVGVVAQGWSFINPVTYDETLKPLFTSSWLYF